MARTRDKIATDADPSFQDMTHVGIFCVCGTNNHHSAANTRDIEMTRHDRRSPRSGDSTSGVVYPGGTEACTIAPYRHGGVAALLSEVACINTLGSRHGASGSWTWQDL